MGEQQALHNERFLLQRVAEGDEDAFRTLVHHYQPVIYFTAIRMTGIQEMAEDIVQDAFLKVWLNRASLPEKENFGGWLYRVAENLVLNAFTRLNHEKKYTRYIQEAASLQYSVPEHAIEQKELENILHKAISKLPPRQLQAYHLVKEQGKTRTEAAHLMQVHPETIKSNLEHAMRFIRAYCLRELEKWPGELLQLLFFIFFL